MPVAALGIVLWGFVKRVNVFDCFMRGVRESMTSVVALLPALMALVTAVTMLRESGALEAIIGILSPLSKLTGIPQQVMPLAVISPISGSGSLTVFEQILSSFGPDSLQGRVASVMMCSSETTFYAVTVYYGAVQISKTRCTLPAAILADITCFTCSALAVRLLMY